MDFNLGLDMQTSKEDTKYDVIIIGGGPAGTTAAIYTSRAGLKTLIIDRGLTAGALGITSKIAAHSTAVGLAVFMALNRPVVTAIYLKVASLKKR